MVTLKGINGDRSKHLFQVFNTGLLVTQEAGCKIHYL